jgi:hypothetical protein
MYGAVCHSAAQAGWAEPSPLATQRDDFVIAAVAAYQVKPTRRQEAAPQIFFELAHHEFRQASLFLRSLA